jgi:hypothetical protein
MTMSGPQRMSGETFAIERLREDPNLDYSTLRREAADAGVAMQPIQYGRARKQLGLPPMQQRTGPVMPTTAPMRAPALGRDDDEQGAVTRAPAASGDDDHDGDDHDERSDTRGDDAQGDADGRDAHGEDTPADAPRTGAADAAAGDLVAPRRKGSAAFDFLVQELRREPGLVYGELRERCEARGWKIAPIMYGRAKAVLGLVPVRPRGAAKKAAASAAAEAMPRTLKQVESVAADRFSKQLDDVRNLEQLVAAVKELDTERRRLRDLLERIVTMIDEALG